MSTGATTSSITKERLTQKVRLFLVLHHYKNKGEAILAKEVSLELTRLLKMNPGIKEESVRAILSADEQVGCHWHHVNGRPKQFFYALPSMMVHYLNNRFWTPMVEQLEREVKS